MLILTLIKVSLKSLWANKMRSFLATLGIIIGVGAVIAMLALGEGAKRQITQKVSSLGSNLMILRPGQKGSRGVQSSTYDNLKLEDAEAILHKVPEVLQLSPVIRGSAQVKYLNQNTRVPITGAAVTYFSIRNFALQHGRPFTDAETREQARLAVIGSQTADDLFKGRSPLGKVIKVNGLNFKIIGLLKVKGDEGWYNPDNQLIIPYTTAMKQLFGLDYLGGIDLQIKKGVDPEEVKKKITAVMRHQHRIPADMPLDFTLQSQAEVLETLNSITLALTLLLGGIASISLLVGGIGIMNIMLVTVTERTREIGIRKALGARNRDILRQFLFESTLISLIGGGIGVALGIGICYLIDSIFSFSTLIQPTYVAIAFSFSAAVGTFFGFYPALRAARQDPIEALRYE
ncbi:MAG: ABC transporter permease [bacterium]|nr:ABC transporter permease [bacterium]